MSETPRDSTARWVGGENSAPRSELTADELFHTLQHERRRLVLRYLLDRTGPADVETLTDQVAAWEHGTAVGELPDEQVQRIYVDLYQSHLPKLDELGLVSYDQSRDVVEPTQSIAAFEPHLALQSSEPGRVDAAGDDRDWLGYYVGTTLTSIALVFLALLSPISPVALSFRAVAGAVTAIHAALTAGLLVSREF